MLTASSDFIVNHFEQFLRFKSVSNSFSEAANKNVSASLRNADVGGDTKVAGSEILSQLHVLCPLERNLSDQHFVKDYSERPDVTFARVEAFSIGFWTHVSWRPNIIGDRWSGLANELAESKIRNFGLPLVQKDICCF